MRDREWLRSFLHLDVRADVLTVPRQDVERQEDTVLRALSMLDSQPGLILADEVGMGKTYEALGVLAARHHEEPTRRSLILTPGPDLNIKWRKELDAFCDATVPMYHGFEQIYRDARNLRDLVQLFADSSLRIAVAPVSMFAGSRSSSDNAYLLSLYFHWKQLRGNQVAAAMDRYKMGRLRRVDVTSELFLGEVGWDRIEPIVETVMRGRSQDEVVAIDRVFAEQGYDLFSDASKTDKLLAELRFRILRELLPDLDLLIIDEAHKLKNADSLRATAVRDVFEGKFAKALFLTATPFQLDVSELRQVLKLFSLARDASAELGEASDRLFADIRAYQRAYDAFQGAWGRLDGAGVEDFRRVYEADPTLATDVEDPGLRVVLSYARRLFELKRERIEPGFRQWMIRSLREDKRQYRKHHRKTIEPANGDAVPFLIYERFIAELFRSKSKTHKAAVQINMVSSYAAAREGAILSDDFKSGITGEAERYRLLLRSVLDGMQDQRGGHPKIDLVVKDAVEAAERGEKTLVFCARVNTLRELRRQIEDAWMDRLVERWRAVFPDATKETIFDVHTDEDRSRGRHSRLQARFHRTQDALYLALRERYLHTVIEIGSFGIEQIDSIVARANEVLSEQRVAGSRAERFDWALAKRCVEHAAALEWAASGLRTEDDEGLEHLVDPLFAKYGYDREPDDLEADELGDRVVSWRIDREQALLIVRPDLHLWSYLKSRMQAVDPVARVRAVERLARYLTKREVPFLVDLLASAKEAGLDVEEIASRGMVDFIDAFWRSPRGRPWCDLIRNFLTHLGKLDSGRREELLEGAVAAGEIVRHTKDGESRERLREAFNTPLYPMVLVANEVMQEGLDLHHQCARVIHHDLAWNPAQLEQRVGRVDRLGSLLHRKRAKDAAATLDVLHPLVARTIDVRLDRVVRARERWLEFLLGAQPDVNEHGVADEPVIELPEAFAEALRVDLGPGGS